LNGSTIFAFDLTPDMCNGYHRHSYRTGAITLHLGFAKPTAEPIQLLALSVYDAVYDKVTKDGPAFNEHIL
jgi:hypothetical protein